MPGKLKKSLNGICLVVSFVFLFSTGLSGCGSSDGGGGGGGLTSNQIANAEAFERFMGGMLLVFLAPTIPTALKFQTTFDCPNGGTQTVNPDGSLTFSNCSFEPGSLLNGTVSIQKNPETGEDSITFDNLQGQGDGKLFDVNGTIQEKLNEDGSTRFQIDVQSTVEGGGDIDTTTMRGDVTVGELGDMTGGWTSDVNGTGRNCNFTGQDVSVFGDDAAAEQMLGEACAEFEPLS